MPLFEQAVATLKTKINDFMNTVCRWSVAAPGRRFTFGCRWPDSSESQYGRAPTRPATLPRTVVLKWVPFRFHMQKAKERGIRLSLLFGAGVHNGLMLDETILFNAD